MDLIGFDRLRVHLKVPDLDGEVVPRDHVATVVAELHVRYTRDDLREETPVGRVFRLLEHCTAEKGEMSIRFTARSNI